MWVFSGCMVHDMELLRMCNLTFPAHKMVILKRILLPRQMASRSFSTKFTNKLHVCLMLQGFVYIREVLYANSVDIAKDCWVLLNVVIVPKVCNHSFT